MWCCTHFTRVRGSTEGSNADAATADSMSPVDKPN
jgi:hypothetical protein